MPAINLSLDVLPEPLVAGMPLVPFMGNIQAGVREYGFGVQVLFPLETGVQASHFVPVTAGVLTPSLAAPYDALAMHLGQGAVLFSYQHPTPDLVAYYEILAAEQLGGLYQTYASGRFASQHGLIRNLPVGATAYFQVRAVGQNGIVSAAAPVYRGKLATPLMVNLKVRGIAGSVIPANAIFPSTDQETGMLILMRAKQEIVLV